MSMRKNKKDSPTITTRITWIDETHFNLETIVLIGQDEYYDIACFEINENRTITACLIPNNIVAQIKEVLQNG